MKVSIIASLFFIVSFFGMYSGVFFLEKTKTKLNGLLWAPIMLVVSISWNAMTAGAINLVHIPINIWTVGIIDTLTAFILWFYIILKQKKQQYFFGKKDVIAYAVLFLLTIIVWKQRFGFHIVAPIFQAVDAPRHMIGCLNIVDSQQITSNMFYSDLYGALFIELLGPFFSVANYYKIFVISELLNFLISGLVFYSLIGKLVKGKFQYAVAVVMIILYVTGYPLNNLLVGFVYWGIGVTIISCIIFLMNEFNKNINCKVLCVVLAILNFGLFETYVLFVPPVFLGTFLYYVYIKKQQGKLLEKNNFIEVCIMFAPAVILGLIYSYELLKHVNVSKTIAANEAAGGKKQTSGNVAGISLEGEIYRDIYSGFIFLLPFSIYRFIHWIKNKKYDVLFFLMVTMLGYMLILFIGGMKGLVSSYYYCKNNYILCMLLFYVTFEGIALLFRESKEFVYSSLSTIFLILVIFVTHFDNRIAMYNENYGVNSVSNYMGIYEYNRSWIYAHTYNTNTIDLYGWIYDNLISQDNSTIVLADFFLDEYWYMAITNTRYNVYESDYEKYKEYEKDSDYICVLYNSWYNKKKSYYDRMEKVYENSAGFVARKVK